MRKARYWLLAFSLFLLPLASVSQSGKGYLLIAIKPDDATIRLDTALVKSSKSHILVDSGSHIIKVWAPGMKLITDTVKITEGRNVLFRRKLEPTVEYQKFSEELQIYKHKKFLMRQLPGLATLAASITYFSLYQINNSDANDYLDKANSSKAKYESLTDIIQIQSYKAEYFYYKDLYDESFEKAVKISNQAKIVIPVAVVITGVFYYYSKKLIKPEFTETPLLSNVSFNYELTGQTAGPRFNCSIKF